MESNNLSINLHLLAIFIQDVLEEQSSIELSKALGFNYNVVDRWINGERQLYWSDFLNIANLKSWNINEILRNVIGESFGPDIIDQKVVLTRIISLSSNRKALEKILSPQKIRRLINGKTKLTLLDFLLIIDIYWQRSLRFLKVLIQDNQKSKLKKLLNNYNFYMTLIAQDLTYNKITHIIDLDIYQSLDQHCDKFIANLIEIKEDEVIEKISLLSRMELIKKEGKLFIRNQDFSDTGINKNLSKKINNQWRNEIHNYTKDHQDEKREKLDTAYLFYPTNKKLEEEIFALSQKFYIDLKTLIAIENGDKRTSLRVMNLDYYSPLSNYQKIKGPFPSS